MRATVLLLVLLQPASGGGVGSDPFRPTELVHTPGELDGFWDLRVRRTSLTPGLLDGVMLIDSAGRYPSSAWIDVIYGGNAVFTVERSMSDGVQGSYRLQHDNLFYQFDVRHFGGSFEGSAQWLHKPELGLDAVRGSRRDVLLREPAFMSGADPNLRGLDPLKLGRLVIGAEDSDSDALIVLVDGEVVVERYFGGQPGLMSLQSITKVFASTAIGMMLDERRIESIDMKLSTWYPEFAGDDRRDITLRHVLTHTSGLDPGSTDELNVAPDRVKYARDAKLVAQPGTTYKYNNRAMELVSGVVEAETRSTMGAYLQQRLFGKMGIQFAWSEHDPRHDSAYAGLSMLPMDLALFGLIVDNDGRWEGESVISAGWIQAATNHAAAPAERAGLGWELRPEAGGLGHSGSQGQYLYIYPAKNVVGLRMINVRKNREAETAFGGFAALLDDLAASRNNAP